MNGKLPDPKPFRQAGSKYAADADVTRLHLSMGRAMSPLIPHRSLLGLSLVGLDAISPGDVIALDSGNGRLAIRRVIRKDPASIRLCCMADSGGRAVWHEAQCYAGTVVWRFHLGSKRRLVMRDRAWLRRALAGLCRLAARGTLAARLTAAPRRVIARLLYAPDEAAAHAEETAFLLRSVPAAVLPCATTVDPPPAGFDWEACLDLAQIHRVCGLVAPAWSSLPAERRPPERVLRLMNEIVQSAEAAWREGLETLSCVASALAQAGVPCLLLKGPGLTACYSGGARERAFTDLDIVVPSAQCDRAIEALAGHGFRWAHGAPSRALLRRAHFHLVLKPPAPRALPVELHWNLVDRANLYRIDMAQVFANAREAHVGVMSIRTLAAVDDLIYMCIHIRKHGALNRLAADARVGMDWIARGDSGNRLIWFVDLHQFLAREAGALDAGRLWQQADAWNAASEVVECLSLLQGFLPSAAAAALLDVAPHDARAEAAGTKRAMRPAEGNTRRLRWAMRVHPVFTLRPVRVLELARLLFPSPARLRRYYGLTSRPALLIRYLLHPGHMVRKILFSE